MDTVTGDDGSGLAGLSDDQLAGVIAAARRLESRAAWYLMAAVAEFAARRRGQAGPAAEFAAEELAAELHLTCQSAAGQLDYACAVAGRLPATYAALAEGRLHPVHVRIIEDETSVLSAPDAARADAELAGIAGSLTFGRLRQAAHRLVLRLDPGAARKRTQAARADAHVRRFGEDSGNAAMVARELPPDEVLASWQHVEQRALDLRAAGVPGTLRELRVRAYLDLLQERDSRAAPAVPGQAAPAQAGPGGPDGTGTGPDPNAAGPAGRTSRHAGPGLAALVNITVPWSTLAGRSEAPAEVAGFGLADACDARDLAAAAARDPATRWCVTALHPDGTAAAHGCVPGRHPPPGTATGGPDPPSGTGLPDYLRRLGVPMIPIARGHCDHQRAEPGYRPSRKLQHLVRARNARCAAPGCGRPAARCDLDHTIAWDRGGLTCECGLAPLCRRHHRAKQAAGWRLEQPEPDVLVWRTPSGRSYATGPTQYAC